MAVEYEQYITVLTLSQMSPNNILLQLYVSAAGDRGSLSQRDVIYYPRRCEGEKNVTEGDRKSCYYCSCTSWNNHALHTVRAGVSLSSSPLAIFYPKVPFPLMLSYSPVLAIAAVSLLSALLVFKAAFSHGRQN